MSALISAALIAAPTLAACSWNDPGHNPYMGTIAAAVDNYRDIPQPVRDKLKQRMARHQYDEMVAIRRGSVTGRRHYAPELRDMHFGEGTVCRTVDRSKWRDDHVERGLVYCEGSHCIVVPTVCRNVSRITRLRPDQVAAGATPEADEDPAAASAAANGSGGAAAPSGSWSAPAAASVPGAAQPGSFAQGLQPPDGPVAMQAPPPDGLVAEQAPLTDTDATGDGTDQAGTSFVSWLVGWLGGATGSGGGSQGGGAGDWGGITSPQGPAGGGMPMGPGSGAPGNGSDGSLAPRPDPGQPGFTQSDGLTDYGPRLPATVTPIPEPGSAAMLAAGLAAFALMRLGRRRRA